MSGIMLTDGREPDDHLHTPDPVRDRKVDKGGSILTCRGFVNVGFLLILGLGILMLFAGYPIITYFMKQDPSFSGGFNLGGINATGQVPQIAGNWGLIDVDTPQEVRTKQDLLTGQTWQLVFSDEFNLDGRTFYPGDDPYWEAVDLHYWQTGNLEWYDPKAIVTRNGSVEITFSKEPNHGLDYTGGMMSTWNKFCFTGGLVEVSVSLPGFNNVHGLWPAVWTMGNLGRAGYGASLEGMWPYTYDSCDVGTVANQTINGLPVNATIDGDTGNGGILSFLPGQRLSRCTCPGESHPGPVHANGEYVGRSAPEIDIFEAQISVPGLDSLGDIGAVSQSGQWGPYNYNYDWFNTSDNLIISDPTISALNTYKGGVFQQATSVVTATNQRAYEFEGGEFAVYGFQYQPGFDGGYIGWISDDKLAWVLRQEGMAADPRVEIGPRPIPQEPLYLIANLGMSPNFGAIDYDKLQFPTTLRIDWVRVYQDPNNINIGCDPPDFPTAEYIKAYGEAYTNPNLTTWHDDFKQPVPRNRLIDGCD
ncbi:glycoside hydrolase family 16 protein [Trametes versicolor FP-101664 SS1]|uniref:glycoside hydrolase family 16 protein n=1 Tax=Trametes versicolor (strain FP-101664) TaxID=717944 RepID=UPI00046227C7|nr:glycoside hydrolase family 16 protein [Trametes versicolor FP-101664 SS1]EIW64599.1 glycoside hydrolase family 16 protein [Trametes versicolor FP-101664 SS1]